MADGEVAKALINVLERISAASIARSQLPRKKPLDYRERSNVSIKEEWRGSAFEKSLVIGEEWVMKDVVSLCSKPRLVAVSKTKPKQMIIEAYNAGQRHFGENYIQELVEKSNDEKIQSSCPDIRWHMIGPIQSNKVKKIIESPNLYCIETVHNAKLATTINNAVKKLLGDKKLKVYLQVNTSGEENKSGISPDKVGELATHVVETCSNLELLGLMTIGAFDHDLSKGPNPDFQTLLKCRAGVCETLCKEPQDLELSMGMSNDFEHAILVGSSNVRVGSTIFGAREYKK